MSNAYKVLFGGKSSTQSATSTPVDTTPAELKAVRGPFANTLTSIFQQGGTPDYTGPLTAAMSPEEQAAMGEVGVTANSANRRGLLEGTLGGQFLPGQPGGNPFLDAAIRSAQRPTLEGLEEALSRSLPGRFTQGGHLINPQGSSAFDRAAAIATGSTADALGDIATKMSFQGYEQERGRQQQAIQLQQQDVDTLMKNLQAQGLPRLIEEQGIERALALFKDKSASLLQALAIAAGAPIAQQAAQQTSSGKSDQVAGIVPTLFPKGLQGG